MMSTEFWRTVALGNVALGQTAFVLLYFTFPWKESFLGRALFFKAFALCLILDVYMVYRVTDFAHADIVFIALYFMLGIGVWVQFIAFLRVVFEHRQDGVGERDSQ